MSRGWRQARRQHRQDSPVLLGHQSAMVTISSPQKKRVSFVRGIRMTYDGYLSLILHVKAAMERVVYILIIYRFQSCDK